MKKHRQHHVWKAYLRGWATNDRLAVLQGGCIRPSQSIDDVAVEHHFYKLHLLSDEELNYIRKFWIDTSAEHLRPIHEGTLRLFALPPRLRAQLTAIQIAANPELVEKLDEWIINGEEDYHSNLENEAAAFIKLARTGDIAFFDNPKAAAQISYFIALQHFRTVMRNQVFDSMKRKVGIDITRSWNIISHIFATNLGYSLYANRKRSPLRLLENNTHTRFITSDQPTVNVLGGADKERSPAHFALYYPISPRRALLLDDADGPCGLADAPLTETIVRGLNDQSVREAHR